MFIHSDRLYGLVICDRIENTIMPEYLNMGNLYDLRTMVFRVFIVVGYICFGSGVFYVLERDQGSPEVLKRLEMDYNNTMMNILKRCPTNDSDLAEIVAEIRRVFLQHTIPNPWSFTSGLMISVQVISTIGYGDTVPKTDAGRMFLIFYATVGIPLMAMMLTTIGEKTKHSVKSCIIAIERNVFKRRHVPRNLNAKSLLAVFVITATLHMVVAWISTVTEDWSFPLAIYVWFVTLTTIGFGDYVPRGSSNKSLYPIEIVYAFTSFFLGLAMIATVFHTVSDWINSKKPPTKEDLKRSISRMTVSLSAGRKGKADISGSESCPNFMEKFQNGESQTYSKDEGPFQIAKHLDMKVIN